MKPLIPTVHMNGTAGEVLRDQYIAAADAVRKAIDAVCDAGPDPIVGYGAGCTITATVRYDDRHGNGHNTFSLTADIFSPQKTDVVSCGALYGEIVRAFPELAQFARWHLVSPHGPLHYVDNTLYWLGYSGSCEGRPSDPPSLSLARKTACWPDMPEDFLAPAASAPIEAPMFAESASLLLPTAALEQLAAKQRFAAARVRVVEALKERLPALLAEFRADVESLGFVW